MNELDVLLAEQIAYYRALAPEYLEDAGVEGVSEDTQDATTRAILAALDAAPEMLEIAAARTTQATSVDFTQADLFTWTPDRRYAFVFFGFWLSHVPPERFASFWSTPLRPRSRQKAA